MAIWQADYILVPQGVGEAVAKSSRRDFSWWEGRDFPRDYPEKFKGLFSASQQSVYGGEEYGDIEGNYIGVSSEHGRVTECYVRLDLRTLDRNDLHTFLNFCKRNEIALLDERDEIVGPDWEKFKVSLAESRAFKFLSDPIGFLSKLTQT